MFGVTTGTTCGAACWYAREETCRCSCGGAAHGALLVEGAEQPRRQSTIQGTRYVLGFVGGYAGAHRVADGFRETVRGDDDLAHVYGNGYRVVPNQQRGGVTWVRPARLPQERWPEVAAWHPATSRERATLLWVREDAADRFDAYLARG